ncbi:MAG: DUF4202 domain-containing protein [Gemmatimonadetes bacterium]|nr:DUF4202 domain-containing protein [Gemmatimonadota bacterium]
MRFSTGWRPSRAEPPVSAAATSDPRERAALDRFAAVHREDPRSVVIGGVSKPRSVHYHERLGHWVRTFDPAASVPLRLAAACQHIRRWEVPRAEYEAGRRGYRQWRSDLAKMHARVAREILTEVGYDQATIARVEALLEKVGLAHDSEVRLFEDAICMVFFENEYADLAQKHDDDKLVDILRRTWGKMSPAGHSAARALAAGMPDRERQLIERATSTT